MQQTQPNAPGVSGFALYAYVTGNPSSAVDHRGTDILGYNFSLGDARLLASVGLCIADVSGDCKGLGAGFYVRRSADVALATASGLGLYKCLAAGEAAGSPNRKAICSILPILGFVVGILDIITDTWNRAGF